MENTRIYIEPYIEIPTQYNEPVSQIKICENCNKQFQTNYCPNCGAKIIERTIIEKFKKHINDITGSEEMWCYHTNGETTLLFSNVLLNLVIYEPDENEMIELNQDMISNCIADFKRVHASNIEIIEKVIGKNVVVKFGVFKNVR